MQLAPSSLRYVLVTPARNEGRFIEDTIHSVAQQTVLPSRWVIVNDGSTDETGVIAARCAARYDWITVVDLPVREGRDFAAKVNAFRAGQQRLSSVEYEVIGNLDADVTLDHDHFAFLMNKFEEDPDLGVAGTVFREHQYNSATDSFEGQTYVSGQCQMFRRKCWEEIGGYFPSRAGGVDWIAVTTARMMGWKTQSFREKWFFHHRPLGTATVGSVRKGHAYGKKDYYMGGHPLWEVFRCTYQMRKHPYVMGGMALLAGYLSCVLAREPRVVSGDLMRFHRREQMAKLRAILLALLSFRRVDGFTLLPVTRPSASHYQA